MARTLCLCTLVAALIILLCPFAHASQTLTLSLEAPTLEGAGPEQTDSAPAANAINASSSRKSDAAKHVDHTGSDSVKVGRVGVVQTASAAIYRTKSTSSHKYSTIKTDTPLAIVREEGDWYGVLMTNGKIGWIQQKNVKMIGYELIAHGPSMSRGSVASRGGFVSRLGAAASEIIRTAEQYYGVRYVFGGTNPTTGMDCSAFVRSVFSQHGINLPRTAREQAQVGEPVSFDQLQPGDRLYFSCKNSYVDHCGIYAGNGMFVHCSASRRGIGVDNLSSSFYARSLVTARRS